jgi:hypothetical protein
VIRQRLPSVPDSYLKKINQINRNEKFILTQFNLFLRGVVAESELQTIFYAELQTFIKLFSMQYLFFHFTVIINSFKINLRDGISYIIPIFMWRREQVADIGLCSQPLPPTEK